MTVIAERRGTEVACPHCGAEILVDIEAVTPLQAVTDDGKAVIDVRIARLWCDCCGREF